MVRWTNRIAPLEGTPWKDDDGEVEGANSFAPVGDEVGILPVQAQLLDGRATASCDQLGY